VKDNLQPIVSMAHVNKLQIIATFVRNVKGRSADVASANIHHAGKSGHWLETAMGIAHNGNNAPDLLGYEMKDGTKSKTTFGDWSPDYQIFKGKNAKITKYEFLYMFGKPNMKKAGRLSWSGEPVPTINKFNSFGQALVVNKNNDIVALYKYSQDKRINKDELIPTEYREGMVILAVWTAKLMKQRVEDKFNHSGVFKCEKDSKGVYTYIVFGPPITFETWISYVKTGDVFFDSGMYDGNIRPYAQWRATNVFWDKILTERY
jgi:hypothetical protein